MCCFRARQRAAAAAGINVARVKIAAYAISSFIAGTAGWMYAYNFGSVSAARFGILIALGFVAFAYIGGITMVSGDQSEAQFTQAHRNTPLGRSSTPQDIADSVCYVAGARALTGTTLLVDGGQHLMALPRDVMFVAK